MEENIKLQQNYFNKIIKNNDVLSQQFKLIDEFKNFKTTDPQLKNELETSYTNKIYKNVSKLIDEIDLYKTFNNSNMTDIIDEKIFNKYNKHKMHMSGGAGTHIEITLANTIKKLQKIIKELQNRPEATPNNSAAVGLWYCENKDKLIQILNKLLVALIMIYFPDCFLYYIVKKINELFTEELTSDGIIVKYKNIKSVIEKTKLLDDAQITQFFKLDKIPLVADKDFDDEQDGEKFITEFADQNYNLIYKIRNFYLYYAILRYFNLVENKYLGNDNDNDIVDYTDNLEILNTKNFGNLNQIFHNILNLINIFTQYFLGNTNYNILNQTHAEIDGYYLVPKGTTYSISEFKQYLVNGYPSTDDIQDKEKVTPSISAKTVDELNNFMITINNIIEDKIYRNPKFTELYGEYYEKLMTIHEFDGTYTNIFYIINTNTEANKINSVKPLINLANKYFENIPLQFKNFTAETVYSLSTKNTGTNYNDPNQPNIFMQSATQGYIGVTESSIFNIDKLHEHLFTNIVTQGFIN
jgi:hypothetical protein